MLPIHKEENEEEKLKKGAFISADRHHTDCDGHNVTLFLGQPIVHQVLAICLRTRQKRVAVQLLYSVISTQQEISYFCFNTLKIPQFVNLNCVLWTSVLSLTLLGTRVTARRCFI